MASHWLLAQASSEQEVNVFSTAVLNRVQYCRDGASQSGVYLASHWLLAQASSEQEVNVFDTVRQIQITRPQFISDMVSILKNILGVNKLLQMVSGHVFHQNIT